MTQQSSTIDSRWRPARDESEHPLAALDGVEVGRGVTLDVRLGPRNSVGATYFRAYLAGELGTSTEYLLFGMQNSGQFPGFNWVEVIDYRDELPHTLEDGQTVYAQVTEGVERRIFELLATLVPQGGHLMAEYDSKARRVTARALTAGVPPAATPLGALLRSVGCGVALRDWYIPEGGREGPRKLQGFRPVSREHQLERAAQMLTGLETYLAEPSDLEWDLQAKTRPLAEQAIVELRSVLRGGEARTVT